MRRIVVASVTQDTEHACSVFLASLPAWRFTAASSWNAAAQAAALIANFYRDLGPLLSGLPTSGLPTQRRASHLDLGRDLSSSASTQSLTQGAAELQPDRYSGSTSRRRDPRPTRDSRPTRDLRSTRDPRPTRDLRSTGTVARPRPTRDLRFDRRPGSTDPRPWR